MNKGLLWLLGLLPAALLFVYAVVISILVLLAAPSDPGTAVVALVYQAVAIWGSLTVILVILEKPVRRANYGLIAALFYAGLIALRGAAAGLQGVVDLVVTLLAICLAVVALVLLRSGGGKGVGD